MTIISKIGVRMIVEGINCVTELLKSSYKMEKVILDKRLILRQDKIVIFENFERIFIVI